MSKAREDILKMLKEGDIDVDEAERLLEALSEGEEKKSTSSEREDQKNFGKMIESVGDIVSSIGPMVKNTVEDVVAGLSGDEMKDIEEQDLNPVEITDGTFEIEKNSKLFLLNKGKTGRGNDNLSVTESTGNECQIKSRIRNIEVGTHQNDCYLRWQGNFLEMETPDHLSELIAKTKGGNITLDNISAPLRAKTLGGNMEAVDLKEDFQLKTLGGDTVLGLVENWKGGNSIASTMGGNITMKLPEDINIRIVAKSLGGSIKVEKDLGEIESQQPLPGSSMEILLGDEDTDSRIKLKTSGGNINIKRDSNNGN